MNRLYRTRCIVVKSSDVEAGINGEEAEAPIMLDLAAVIAIRPAYDFEAGRAEDGQTIAELGTGASVTLCSDFETVAAAWQAYRTAADALNRIRN